MDFGSHLKCPHHSELVRKEPEDHQIETIEPKRIDVVENSILVWQSSRMMRNFFCKFNFQWSFSRLFLSYSCFWQTQEKRQVFNMRIPLSWAEDFLVMLLAFFTVMFTYISSVLKFRFSNDVSGLFTYSIKSFQFVFITVSLSDSQSGSSQRVKEKQCITYFIRCIFWKSHFKVENESVVVERRRPIHDRKQRCFKAFRNISKMPPPPWSSYMCGYIRIHTHESSRKKSCQYAHKHLLFQFCSCFWKLQPSLIC